ncbi:hypothetical protein LBMAG53_19230 [Planctomycetota bacterium]|nr:hypothetical protein LBMAG53_19230 [Planctomycetota bacterium]
MDRKRIRDEVIEIMAHKLPRLPPLPVTGDDDGFDYDGCVLRPEITDNQLDIAEVTMDLEDAFGVNFDEAMPGDQAMDTIGKVVDFIHARIERNFAPKAPVKAKPAAAAEDE